MKTADLKKLYGSLEAIGRVFAPLNEGKPLTKSAVSQWGRSIPPLREYQLRELVPDIDERIAATKRPRERQEGARQ